MKDKNPSIESLERKYRRHEVSFSQIEQTTGQDIENVIANHGTTLFLPKMNGRRKSTLKFYTGIFINCHKKIEKFCLTI